MQPNEMEKTKIVRNVRIVRSVEAVPSSGLTLVEPRCSHAFRCLLVADASTSENAHVTNGTAIYRHHCGCIIRIICLYCLTTLCPVASATKQNQRKQTKRNETNNQKKPLTKWHTLEFHLTLLIAYLTKNFNHLKCLIGKQISLWQIICHNPLQ